MRGQTGTVDARQRAAAVRPDLQLNRTITLSYEAGRVKTITDPFGRTTTYRYTGDHLTAVEESDGRLTSYEYETAGAAVHALSRVIQPGGVESSYRYDDRGRLVQVSAGGTAVTRAYDAVGNVTVSNAEGQSVKVSFDHRNLIARVDDGQQTLNYHVSEDGTFSSVTDQLGRTHSYTVDRNGDITLTDPAGNKILLDIQSNLDSSLGGPLAGYSRCVGDRPKRSRSTSATTNRAPAVPCVRVTFAASRARTTPRKPGRTTTTPCVVRPGPHLDQRSRSTIECGYDSFGRVTSKRMPEGSVTTFTYDGHGNLTSITDNRGNTTYAYDGRDRLVRITQPNGTSRYTYDDADRAPRSPTTPDAGYTTPTTQGAIWNE
jgi:YD repeat-containing protein